MIVFLLAATLTGRALVLETCVQCHDMRAIESQQKSEAQWRRTVNEMIWRGAQLMPGEADAVIKYLSTERRGGLTPAGTGAPLPPGKGRELVMASCVQCHDLQTTTSQRKTAGEWHRSVEQMARLGAKLNGSEIRLVSSYLAHAFGPDKP